MSELNLNQQYNRQNVLNFLADRFLPDDFEPFTEKIETGYSPAFINKDSITILGKSPSLDLTVFELKHKSVNDPRVGISKDAFKILSEYYTKRALVFFVSDSSPNYRFSLITLDLKLEGRKVTKEYSNPRRYSFFLGPEAKTHTPEQFLVYQGRVGSFDDLQKRFSIEVVNKEFYNKIAVHFTKLVGGKRKNGSSVADYTPLLKMPSMNDHKTLQEFGVRLIGRLIFCWFLKMKKSKSDTRLINDSVLSSRACAANRNYYHSVIEKLFFEVLNTEQKNRKKEFLSDDLKSIPFLNGGLFEPLDDDFYKTDNNTGISQHINSLKVPDAWLKEFLEILETYNFTVDENTSVDIDLSVDPEMLGRIFENLLAEIVPETGESARKATGSFYTPRPIVDYMVDESLKQYLVTNTGIEEERIARLITVSSVENDLNNKEKLKILDAIDKLKVLDPACGSGAFPMGMLHKILYVLQQVDPKNEVWNAKVLDEYKDPVFRRVIEQKIMHDLDLLDYTRKLGIIQKTIFGVDIQEIAVEISKLRCFLSLIVDEKIEEGKPNKGIQSLPNLEFKFVAANTLIGLPKVEVEGGLFNLDKEIKQLKDAREDYFSSSGKDKKNDIEKYRIARDQLTKEILNNRILSRQTKEAGMQLVKWDPFINESNGWFDPEWMFGIKDGFDIVIGNPPYIQLQKDGGYYADLYQSQGYQSFARTGDIYCLFYEKSQKILRHGGINTFITSNKWMRAGYGEKLREFFAHKTNPLQLIDFGGYKVFESATVDTNILISQKGTNGNKTFAATIGSDFNQDIDLSEYIQANGFVLNHFNNSDSWILSNPIEQKIKQKIEAKGIPLKDWDISIFRGVLTGYNEAFIIDGAKRKELIREDPNSKEIIKPILRGRDIKRYHAEFADLWLLFIPWHFPLHEDPRVTGASKKAEQAFRNDYPAIYNHLLQYKIELSARNKAETGIRYEWYALQRCANTYYEEFEKEKIAWQRITREPIFVYSPPNQLILDSMAFLSNLKGNKNYLLSVLNSNLVNYWVYCNVHQYGATGYRLSNQYVEEISIPRLSKQEQKPFEDLVDRILAKKENDQDSTKEEQEIDKMVYALYGLTQEEIEYIEGRVG